MIKKTKDINLKKSKREKKKNTNKIKHTRVIETHKQHIFKKI